MPYTKDDVGDIPGKPPLGDAERQAIADEWNANAAARAAERADPPLAHADMIEALFAHAPESVRAAAGDMARARARAAGHG